MFFLLTVVSMSFRLLMASLLTFSSVLVCVSRDVKTSRPETRKLPTFFLFRSLFLTMSFRLLMISLLTLSSVLGFLLFS